MTGWNASKSEAWSDAPSGLDMGGSWGLFWGFRNNIERQFFSLHHTGAYRWGWGLDILTLGVPYPGAEPNLTKKQSLARNEWQTQGLWYWLGSNRLGAPGFHFRGGGGGR